MMTTLLFDILTTDVSKAISEISMASIIKWYGILCLATLPISLLALVFIYKKRPNIVSAFDKAVDKMIDGKQKNDKPAEETKESKDAEEPSAPKVITVEEDNEEAGIPNMVLQIGDKYQCYLSKKNRNDVLGGDFTWGTDNPFVGDINEIKGIFEAKKVGKTYIECGAKQIRIYYAEVKPNCTDWFGYYPINDVLSKTCLANIKVRELTRRILKIDETKNFITYDWDEMTLSYQINKKDEVVRALFRIPDKEELINTVKEAITEYMEPLKIKDNTQDKFYFYHMCGLDEDYPESVDYTAFLRKSKNGDWYFGIGECWRVGASDSEIRENTEMVERSFKDLLDKQDIPAIVGTKLKKESKVTHSQSESTTQKAVSRRNRKAEITAEQDKPEEKPKIQESVNTEIPETQEESQTERPNVQLDDPTDVPETNPGSDEEDYTGEGSQIEIESGSDDPFADFSEAGEQEYGHEPSKDINHEEQ